jgi:hypothetical protein
MGFKSPQPRYCTISPERVCIDYKVPHGVRTTFFDAFPAPLPALDEKYDAFATVCHNAD